jgi:alpha-methylacyl-CoA racemase
MERLELGPNELHSCNPGLVYARLTGWGQTGPLADRAGHDINYIAVSGVLSAIGRAGEPPVPPVNLLGDLAGGSLFCALGILAALFERQRSGLGQVVDAAMLDGSASLFTAFAAAAQSGRWRDRGTNIIDTGAHYYEVYETADGGYMSVGAIEGPFYEELLAGLGLADDPEFRNEHDRSRWPVLKERLAAVFRRRTRAEWSEIFAGRDACVYPVLSLLEAPFHPHNVDRAVFAEHFGVRQPSPAPRFDRTPGRVGGPPPVAGQHSHDVLREADLTDSQISALTGDRAAAGSRHE